MGKLGNLATLSKTARSYIRKDTNIRYNPLRLWIEPTSYCNLKCASCPNQFIEKRHHGFMDLQLFSSIIYQASDLGIFDVRLFLRGEPLLHKDITEMVRICKANGIFTEIHTNAMLLTPEISKNLIKAGIDLISFSIDGMNRHYYSKYRIGGNLEKVISNTIDFLKLKKMYSRKKPWVKIQLIRYHKDVGSGQEEIRHASKHFRGMPVDEIVLIDAHGWGGKFQSNTDTVNKKICGDVYHALSIYWDGTVVPCCLDFFNEYELGNLFEESLHNIWHGSRMKDLRGALLSEKGHEISLCRECDMLKQEDIFHVSRNILGVARSIIGRNRLIASIERRGRLKVILNNARPQTKKSH